MKALLFLFLPAILLLSACGNDDADSLDEQKRKSDSLKLNEISISEETIHEIVGSIPTPMEMSSIIEASGIEFDGNILNPPENVKKYNTNFEVAMNVGVYSADLGYINIYEKTFSSIEYLSSIKKLTETLKVGQFFDFETLDRLASNNAEYDSIIYICTNNFEKMGKHLRDQKRGELSVLMVTGAWLEGLHIATAVCKEKETKDIVEKIGYEKINLDNMLIIVNAYKSASYFAQLGAELKKLKKIYSKVIINKEHKEPETKEVNGQLVIVDNSKTTVQIDETTIKEITNQVAEIRKKFILK